MEKHKWEKAWEEKKFIIKTLEPSILVSRYENDLLPEDWVLDVGCGNGRNAIYMANRGCNVDCFDVMDLNWVINLSDSIKDRVHFLKSNILNYPYAGAKYRAIIVARVIQYLNREELNFLLNKIKLSLEPNGFLLLSFNTRGGIFDKKDIDVPTYVYSIEEIKILLKKIFKNVIISEGSKKSKHVNYIDDIISFDIFASHSY